MRSSFLGLFVLIILAACSSAQVSPSAAPQPTRTGILATYGGPAPSSTPSPTNAATVTPLPTATPTPRTHVVKAKEDLWGIALRYGLSLEDLLTANPTVDPRFLSIGANLQIPAPLYTPTPDPDNPPLPTPVSLSLAPPDCYLSREGGLWCFTSVTNSQDYALESVSAVIRLFDQASGEIRSQTAYTPLNQVLPGGQMALSAYFPAPIPADFDTSAELITALPVPPSSGRFLSVQQTDTQINIAPDGLSAAVNGIFQLSDAQAAASRISAAAIAYDAAGVVTGIRRWESLEPLSGPNAREFSLTVYAAGPAIDRVVVLVEAYP